MRSFKEFLQEDTVTNVGKSLVYYIIMIDVKRSEISDKNIYIEKLKREANASFVTFHNLNDNYYSIAAKIDIDGNFNEETAKQINGKIDSIFSAGKIDPYTFSYGTINVVGFPTVKIDFDKVTLSCYREFDEGPLVVLKNLTGIEKFISCKSLTLYQSNHVERGVLSILKIPRIQRFIYSQQDTVEQDRIWQKIVENYVGTGKNISACQTELMKNGMKEYARS